MVSVFSLKCFFISPLLEAYRRPVGTVFGVLPYVEAPPPRTELPCPLGLGKLCSRRGGFNVMLDTENCTYGSPVCFLTSGILKGVAWGEFVTAREGETLGFPRDLFEEQQTLDVAVFYSCFHVLSFLCVFLFSSVLISLCFPYGFCISLVVCFLLFPLF